MIRTLLFAASVAVGISGFSQCVPNPLYADSVYGVWPDTTENFIDGNLGVFYSDTLQLLIPSDAGLIDPLYNGFAIDSVALTQITGLPPGIDILCNSQTSAACTYLTGVVGCGLLEGTPTQTGTYTMSIEVVGYVQIFGITQAIPLAYTGYSITIGNLAGVDDLAIVRLGKVLNVPNPFADRTTIEFNLSKAAPVKVKVFNLVGEELWNKSLQGKAGLNRLPFGREGLESGIYIYRLEAAGTTWTGRMMVNR
ncbi:MAG: T9SS type A sorting domain-containing protein [Flavobacteriales bacterium]|nr:T9SS type A sorting domain-containing protein [Flavobacteriales bacterium]MBP9079904.1 T9SS type A sorting domain-containing protein [Flavobacteriales bacterium]